MRPGWTGQPPGRRGRAVAGVLLVATAVVLGCGEDPAAPAVEEECGPFPEWETSPYILPYPAGHSYEMRQGNCSGFGHTGFWRHGYDFIMPIGEWVIAARSGTVGWANDGCTDGVQSCTNLITVLHDDGTVALYSHLTLGGVLVASGDPVAQGDTIGRSGNTGLSTEPHLHFSIHPCNELPGLPGAAHCPSLPFTVRNTDPNPEGLAPYRVYLAR